MKILLSTKKLINTISNYYLLNKIIVDVCNYDNCIIDNDKVHKHTALYVLKGLPHETKYTDFALF